MNRYLDTLTQRLALGARAWPLPSARMLLVLACLGWAGWRLYPLWTTGAAAPASASPPDPAAAAAQVAERHWFGTDRPPVAPALTVLGVFAPGHGAREPGFAITRHDGGDGALWSGQRLGDWQVVRIAPEGLTLAQGRARQFYPLSRDNGHVPAAAADDAEGPPPPGDDE